MRNTLLYFFLSIYLPLHGQSYFHADTVQIKEVIITRKRTNSDISGFKKLSVDSSVIKNFSNATLADLLSSGSNIFIKSYGLGGTATPSFRGTGASHTQVSWNNININHPMLGQSDLSLIPAGLIDDIQIYFGGASMVLNSGGIGGIINLETKPDWNKETVISISPEAGSYGRYSGLVRVKSGNSNFQSVTKAFVQAAENDFRYLNTEIAAEPVWETRINSQVNQQGFIQEIYYRKTKNVLSARLWYQSADRNLPSSMLTQQVNTGESQYDLTLRTMLNYDIFRGQSKIFLTGAWILNRLNYTNILASIQSRNLAETLILKAGTERLIGENINLRFILNEESEFVKSNNYSQKETRNRASFTASAEKNGDERFGALILIREILDNNKFLLPDFSAGFQFRIVEEKEYVIKTSISRNSKIPSMNDLYWAPGGNPELKNEYALTYEFTYEMNQKITYPLSIKYDLTLFRNNIKDMILWHPGQFSYWTADNIQNVNTMGLESSFSLNYKMNNIASAFSAGYSYTRANSVSKKDYDAGYSGKQLMYIPENQANTSLRVSYHNVYSSWIANITGRRYITVDNSRFLPGYLLNNILTGYKITLKNNLLDINFTIENLFNVNYQTIAYHPLPGRSYLLKILVQINK